MNIAHSPLPFDNSFCRLPGDFYTRLAPTPVSAPALIRVNAPLCRELGVDAEWLSSEAGVAVLAGNALPEGAEPLAAVYAGHQFGHYNPQLGDGRAILLGELRHADRRRVDLQLKGSGRTPYSRGGDGRSPLGPVLREYLVSEAMHALGVPTSRALAAVSTGEPVMRERAEPGAILARVAASHIRVGSFQFFAARDDQDALQRLLHYSLERHYPQHTQAENPALALLQATVSAQARLIARWQALGFVHGVMNTDNMLICGETIDYGPCAFMEAFNPDAVFSYIDHAGRYAYRNQPGIAHWNLARLAEALLPLLHPEQEPAVALAQDALAAFPEQFADAHADMLAQRLGLSVLKDNDSELLADLFALLAEAGADHTLSFRYLAAAAADEDTETRLLATLYTPPPALSGWMERWRQRLAAEGRPAQAVREQIRAASPLFIPRNHRVKQAIDRAERGDFALFHQLAERLSQPYSLIDNEDPALLRPARPEEQVQTTFCGT